MIWFSRKAFVRLKSFQRWAPRLFPLTIFLKLGLLSHPKKASWYAIWLKRKNSTFMVYQHSWRFTGEFLKTSAASSRCLCEIHPESQCSHFRPIQDSKPPDVTPLTMLYHRIFEWKYIIILDKMTDPWISFAYVYLSLYPFVDCLGFFSAVHRILSAGPLLFPSQYPYESFDGKDL